MQGHANVHSKMDERCNFGWFPPFSGCCTIHRRQKWMILIGRLGKLCVQNKFHVPKAFTVIDAQRAVKCFSFDYKSTHGRVCWQTIKHPASVGWLLNFWPTISNEIEKVFQSSKSSTFLTAEIHENLSLCD